MSGHVVAHEFLTVCRQGSSGADGRSLPSWIASRDSSAQRYWIRLPRFRISICTSMPVSVSSALSPDPPLTVEG